MICPFISKTHPYEHHDSQFRKSRKASRCQCQARSNFLYTNFNFGVVLDLTITSMSAILICLTILMVVHRGCCVYPESPMCLYLNRLHRLLSYDGDLTSGTYHKGSLQCAYTPFTLAADIKDQAISKWFRVLKEQLRGQRT